MLKKIKNKIKSILKKPPVISVMRFNGLIGNVSSFKSGLSLEYLNEQIEKGFNITNLKAFAIIINSPGGSPVQSELIFNRIRELALEKKVSILTFIEDVAASGGYWIACAGDEIFAAQNSLIGSIGVISAGFGFDKTIKKLGIDRRVYSEGQSKSILDPFSPEKKEDIKILKEVQKEVYENFKELVCSRRNNINEKYKKDIFSGAFWSSKKAKDLGLIDDIGTFHNIINKKFGKKVKINKLNLKKSWLKSKFGLLSSEVTDSILNVIEEKLIRNKFNI